MESTDSAGQSSSSSAKKGTSKIIPLIVVIILLIVLGVGSFMLMGKKNVKPTSSQTVMKNEASPTSSSMFSSIQEALSKSLSLQCDYTDESGKKIISYIKNGAVRTDMQGASAKDSGSVIMKDKKMYYWNGKTGTVLAFDITSMMEKVTPSVKPQVSQAQQNPGDVVESLEKFKKSCKTAVVADSLFTPPADVKFTDISAMMKKVAVPSGVTGAMTEEQVKALQEKYQQ